MTKKPKIHRNGFVQHYATPERQLKRKEVAFIGIRQYKKIHRALRTLTQGEK